jgi:hypothetical protein
MRRARGAGLAALGALALAAAAPAGDPPDTKRREVAGYGFEQLTDNDRADIMPRVSPSGLVAWQGRYHLAGARSRVDRDLEVFLLEGEHTTQVTDNDVDDTRCVVNDAGALVWQTGGNDGAEIVLLRDGRVRALTRDPRPRSDRYPDLNSRGAVVWGRRNRADTGWLLAIHEPGAALPYRVLGRAAYRPHLNDHDRLGFEGGEGVHDLTGKVVTRVPPADQLGYRSYRRIEINGRDQLAFEAEPAGSRRPDYEGPRDILFWDGQAMHVLYSSEVWHGRADLNDAGVVAWEGFGGLAGSRSGSDDREIFVFDPACGRVLQLTDDDLDDRWPTVSGDGAIVWQGTGGYPGARSGPGDSEIFRARPTGSCSGRAASSWVRRASSAGAHRPLSASRRSRAASQRS